jgi:hypothetical protein
MHRRGDRESGKIRLGCLFSLLIVVAALYFGFQFLEVRFRFYRMQDTVNEQASFAPVLDDATIRARLAARADSLGIPLGAPRAWEVRRVREGTTRMIVIRGEYRDSVVLDLPGVRKVWRFTFTPSASEPY